MSVESRIERVELYAVADDHADTLPWAADQEPLLHTNNIVRILCEDGHRRCRGNHQLHRK